MGVEAAAAFFGTFTPRRRRAKSRPTLALPIVLIPHPHVRVDPSVLAGSPYVDGSRVPVRRLWAFFRNGTSVERILRRYPQLGPAKVFDALAFALDNQEVVEADLAREAELLNQEPSPARREPPAQIELPFAERAALAPARRKPPAAKR